MPRVAALLGVGQISDVMAVGVGVPFPPAGLCQQRHRHRGSAGGQHRRGDGAHGLVSAGRAPAARRAIEARSVEVDAADAHPLRLALGGQRRPAGSADARRAWSPAAGRWPAPRTSSCCTSWPMRWGGGGRFARGGGCRLRAERAAGRPDRQDHRAGAVRRARHLRRHPASDRHQGCAHHRRRSTRTARRRSSRSPISAWWATCSRSCRSWSG